MNWTESALYRSSRRSLKKPNAPRQRQREYFARTRARAAGVIDPVLDARLTPPPRSSPVASRRSHGSSRSHSSRQSASSSGRRHSGLAAAKLAEELRRRIAPTPVPSAGPFQSVSQFLAERADPAIREQLASNIRNTGISRLRVIGDRGLSRPQSPASTKHPPQPLTDSRLAGTQNTKKSTDSKKETLDQRLRQLHR